MTIITNLKIMLPSINPSLSLQSLLFLKQKEHSISKEASLICRISPSCELAGDTRTQNQEWEWKL